MSELAEDDPAHNNWFADKSTVALAGRCMLDVIEYTRSDPKLPARFRQVANAHTIRLLCRVLADPNVGGQGLLTRLRPRIEDIARQLLVGRQSGVPHYGDDFWDWAIILESLAEVHTRFPDGIVGEATLQREFSTFCDAIKEFLPKGLTIPGNAGEWYGPATATRAHRLLRKYSDRFDHDAEALLGPLEREALTPIKKGKYRGRDVLSHHVLWHYGQVAAEFPPERTAQQASVLADLSRLTGLESAERVYALARVLQGAHKVGDIKAETKAIKELYGCQNLKRPLGQGLMGDNIKGSLNVLEALWPIVPPTEKGQIGLMINTLDRLHISANTIGLVVAVDREFKAVSQALKESGSRVARETAHLAVIEHKDFRVVVCKGKALVGVTDATRTLIDEHKARWVIMSGIAGSLGTLVSMSGKPDEFRGADKGHVIAATSLAPFRIRDKVRKPIENASVPLRGFTWRVIPTDPMLFGLAHEAGATMFGESGRFHEGLIVTGTGIKDTPDIKKEILDEFPGGLAVEEEGYPVGLLCLLSGVPYLIVRGISDRVGDKKEQGSKPEVEEAEQMMAALTAARLVVSVVQLLSQRW